MRAFRLALMVCAAGCGHGGARPMASGSSASGTPAGATTRPDAGAIASDPLPDLSTLRLAVKQVASVRVVNIELTLTNVGSRPVEITANPQFENRPSDGFREGEVEFRLEDARGRSVPVQCIMCRMRAYEAERSLLAPGQSATLYLSLTPGCYSLVPGERLSFEASYANLYGRVSVPVREVPIVHTSGWSNITVPLDWPDGAAARQGVAADGAPPRR